MTSSKLHKILGLVLLLPFLAWIFTGAIFLIKPGYAGAYERITPKLYDIEHESLQLIPDKSWKEIRFLKTILGNHLLVKTGNEWQQLDPQHLNILSQPSAQQEKLLLSDAISQNPERYGTIERREGNTYITSTGVELQLNWNTLVILQKGNDTKVIGLFYKIHSLNWLGNRSANLVLGAIGLLALSLLVFFGVVLYVRRRSV